MLSLTAWRAKVGIFRGETSGTRWYAEIRGRGGAACPKAGEDGTACPKTEQGEERPFLEASKEAGAISSCREGGAACPSARQGGAACPRAKEGGAACPGAKEGGATAILCKRGRDRCLSRAGRGGASAVSSAKGGGATFVSRSIMGGASTGSSQQGQSLYLLLRGAMWINPQCGNHPDGLQYIPTESRGFVAKVECVFMPEVDMKYNTGNQLHVDDSITRNLGQQLVLKNEYKLIQTQGSSAWSLFGYGNLCNQYQKKK
ncbi:UNVERIFIED_CONTAM: hypothetical protein FKN15_030527 [Acipenser sinensis]